MFGCLKRVFHAVFLLKYSRPPTLPDMELGFVAGQVVEKTKPEVKKKKSAKPLARGTNRITPSETRKLLILLSLWAIVISASFVCMVYALPYMFLCLPNCKGTDMNILLKGKNYADLKCRTLINIKGQISFKVTDKQGQAYFKIYQLNTLHLCNGTFAHVTTNNFKKHSKSSSTKKSVANPSMRSKRSIKELKSQLHAFPNKRNILDLAKDLEGSFDAVKAKYENIQNKIASQAAQIGNTFSFSTMIKPKSINTWRMKRQTGSGSIGPEKNIQTHDQDVPTHIDDTTAESKERKVRLQEEYSNNLDSGINSGQQSLMKDKIAEIEASLTKAKMEINTDGKIEESLKEAPTIDVIQETGSKILNDDHVNKFLLTTLTGEANEEGLSTTLNPDSTKEFSNMISNTHKNKGEVFNEMYLKKNASTAQILGNEKGHCQDACNNDDKLSDLPNSAIGQLAVNINNTDQTANESPKSCKNHHPEVKDAPPADSKLGSCTDDSEHKEEAKDQLKVLTQNTP